MHVVSFAVQIVVSFVIGDIARWVGSTKWTIVFLIPLSFAENFVYSCTSVISLGSILGGGVDLQSYHRD